MKKLEQELDLERDENNRADGELMTANHQLQARNDELVKQNNFLKSELNAVVKYAMQHTEFLSGKQLSDAHSHKKLAKVIKNLLKPKTTPCEDT